MSTNYNDWQNWILQNIYLLGRKYGTNNVMLNRKTWNSILIRNYTLPRLWKQRTSKLIIELPPKSKIFYSPPNKYYLDLGLRLINGKRPLHYYDGGGYNDMKKKKMARFSFHLEQGWNPKLNCHQGTNLTHVIHGLYKGLEVAAKETMR